MVSGDHELTLASHDAVADADRRLDACQLCPYARTLRAYGYRVVKAPTSGAAQLIATIRQTDIVVTDVHITGWMRGLELTRRLRTHTRTTTVPIIVLTDVSRPQDADLALKAGANMVLERPVRADVLQAEIARLLGS